MYCPQEELFTLMSNLLFWKGASGRVDYLDKWIFSIPVTLSYWASISCNSSHVHIDSLSSFLKIYIIEVQLIYSAVLVSVYGKEIQLKIYVIVCIC